MIPSFTEVSRYGTDKDLVRAYMASLLEDGVPDVSLVSMSMSLYEKNLYVDLESARLFYSSEDPDLTTSYNLLELARVKKNDLVTDYIESHHLDLLSRLNLL